MLRVAKRDGALIESDFRKRENARAMLLRNAVALNPPLDSRVVTMLQGARDRADAPSLHDDLGVAHARYVRSKRTVVNVENVRTVCKGDDMSDRRTVGERLLDLKRRAGGVSLDEIARLAGYRGRSSVQGYFNAAYDADYLPPTVAERLATALATRGIDPAEVLAMARTAEIPSANGVPFKMEGAPDITMPNDVPVYGTALGSDEMIQGEAIEQTTLNRAETVTYFRRPPILDRRADVYGLFVQGASMSPRFEPGEAVFVEGKRPPRIGDDVVVYLVDGDDKDLPTSVLIKRLVRRTSAFIELRQFNPDLTFTLDVARIFQVHRVIPFGELFD